MPWPSEKACSDLGSPASAAGRHSLTRLARACAEVLLSAGTILQLTSSCFLYLALLAVRLPSETLETQPKGHLSCPLPPALS